MTENYLRGAKSLRRSSTIVFVCLLFTGVVLLLNVTIKPVPTLIRIPSYEFRGVLEIFAGFTIVFLVSRAALYIFGREKD